jgi:ATP-binding cassette subfamily B multidrug efflux pump
LIMQGQLSLGELVAFTAYLGQLIDPIRRLGMVIPAVVIASSAAERIFEVLDAIPEVKDTPDATPMPTIQGHIRFESVGFKYGKQTILNQIEFEVNPGQVIALLGPTGSGKSTIVHLLPRFYDPTSGRIMIDGKDIREVTLHSLRSQIGIVMQETTLFATTIRENITFGRSDVSEDEVISAAKAAQAHDFIIQIPNGYDALIGEKGVTLSGGQKQRLAIARSIIHNPRILILDDATSSVDSETEYLIQLAIDRLVKDRTTFIIAHRISTLHRADIILVIQKGTLVAKGKHEQLLHDSPLYQQIYRSQLVGSDNYNETIFNKMVDHARYPSEANQE